MAKTCAYSAVTDLPYHYAEGVLVPGESAELTDEQAARGLASGQIALTPQPSQATPAAKKESAPE